MKEKIRIQDDSGDKKYFTIIPNYIANHSTANDQALYFQMKRYAGEDGKCFATEKTLCKQLGIGRRALWKARDYLLIHGWITEIETTKSKTRPIKTYKINDIWKMNNDYYQEIVAEKHISIKEEIVAEKKGDSCQMQHKIVAEKHIEEERSIKKNQEEEFATQKSVAVIPEIIKLFEDVNPSISKYYGNKTQRAAVERMLGQYGREKLKAMIGSLPRINAMKFWPKSTTPLQFENNIPIYKAKTDELKVNNENKVFSAL